MTAIHTFNRQRTRSVNQSVLRQVTRCLLLELLELQSFELAIHLVNRTEMAFLNESFLRHAGSTDVITFDYGSRGPSLPSDSRAQGLIPHPLTGEIFICIDDALENSRRFRTTWQSELVRYIIHGILHLRGYDDLKPGPRKAMKRQENQLLKQLSRRFAFGKLEKRLAAPQRRPARKPKQS